jgi:hypothetical protein
VQLLQSGAVADAELPRDAALVADMTTMLDTELAALDEGTSLSLSPSLSLFPPGLPSASEPDVATDPEGFASVRRRLHQLFAGVRALGLAPGLTAADAAAVVPSALSHAAHAVPAAAELAKAVWHRARGLFPERAWEMQATALQRAYGRADGDDPDYTEVKV